MRFQLSAAATAVLFSSLVDAQVILSKFVFGHEGRIHTENGQIPHFHLRGDPNQPDVLSNRIVLTPIAPGNEKSSLWADNDLLHTTWVTDVDFRATGPERAGGNLNIWLVENGPEVVHADSIYTVKQFKGLGIVVDTQGGYGMVRGFLNDGSKDFSREHNVDSLAFGNCKYGYRNLGRPMPLKISQSPDKFSVEIDGRPCFSTDKVQIPPGYRLGISATTPEMPDSFEVFKLLVMSDTAQPPSIEEYHKAQAEAQAQAQRQVIPDQPVAGQENQNQQVINNGDSSKQIADIQNRLQNLDKQVASVYQLASQGKEVTHIAKGEIMNALDSFRSDIRGELNKLNALDNLNKQVNSLESELKRTRGEMQNMIRSMEHKVTNTLGSHHSTLSDSMEAVHSNHSRLVWLVIGGQLVLVALYVGYKKKAQSQRVKYL